jgi:hypothetical protein
MGLALVMVLSATAWGGQPEALLGLSTDFDQGTLTIEVASSGCTGKADFRFEFSGDRLTVVRTRRDDCKAMPQKTALTFTLQEAGLTPHKPFGVVNRFIASEYLVSP